MFNKRKVFNWMMVLALVTMLGIPQIFAGLFGPSGPSLVRMEPNGEVPPKSNLTFTFSEDLAPAAKYSKTFTTDKVKFQPVLPGKLYWVNARQLRYLPETAMQPSTKYTVEFDEDFVSEFNKKLIGNRKLEFVTERIRVLNSNLSFVLPTTGERGFRFEARLSFNYPVKPDDLERNLSLKFTDKGEPIRFIVRMLNDNKDAVITTGLLQPGKTARRVELSLPQGFRGAVGTIGLEERFFRTADLRERRALTINDIDSTSNNGQNSISIRCSEPLDPDTVENFISVTPKCKFRITVMGETILLSGEEFKSGWKYIVELQKGLPSLNGNPLERNYSDTVSFPDLEPSINFNAPGRYLSNRGYLNLGLETVNTTKVEVEIAKIYPNNIVGFLSSLNEDGRCYSSDLMRYGRILFTDVINIQNVENEVVTTPIYLGEYLSGQKRGIFQVTICEPEYRWRSTSKIAVVTNLGILAKMGQDDLVVWINALDNLSPRPGVKVTLKSYNNQEIVTGETDAQGMIRFTGLKAQMENYRSYVLVAEDEEDLSFLCLADSVIDLTDFSVEGRPFLLDGYEAYLYPDRGVFRPGETANITAIVRGPKISLPPEFPIRLEVVGPDGTVYREYAGNTGKGGIATFPVEFPDYARTGQYTAVLSAGGKDIGRTAFNVEEFMPDRIKVETETDKERYTEGEEVKIKVKAVNLFGPPAAGRQVELWVRLEAQSFSPPSYRSYTFGDPERTFEVVEAVVEQGELDENGSATFTYNFPGQLRPPGLVRAVFVATVFEEGGRAVSSYKAVEYHPDSAYLGTKAEGEYYAEVGKDYPVRLAFLDPAGQLIPGETTLNVEIFKLTWHSIYRRDRNGRYTYHCERQKSRIARDTVRLTGGTGSFKYRPGDYGCYELVFTEPGTGVRSVLEFYATGWGYAPWAMDHPDRVELDLDKTRYRAGEEASIQIKAPFPGRVMVTVEREKVYDVKVVELKENTGVIKLPIKPEYQPNVYVSVHLIRATKTLDQRAPTRAFGVTPLAVDCSNHAIPIKIQAPAEIRPNREVSVDLMIPADKYAPGETWVTLAAVDEGICQLTEFQTPDPLGFFYGKRSLGLTTYDLYGMLLPEVAPINTASAPGGDEEMERVRRRNLNPVSIKRVKPVSLWSGLVQPDGSGKATIKLTIPQFNGTLRLMAVAASGGEFGSATYKMLVRDQLVMNSTFPRFLAPGDRAVIPVSLYNASGKDGNFEIKLKLNGPVTMDGYDWKQVTLKENQEKTVHFAVIAKNAVGGCRFDLTAEGNGVQVAETVELGVRPAEPRITRAFSGAIAEQKPLELQLGGSFMPGTEEYTIVLAPFPGLQCAGGLQYVLGYEYGCLEQTTSKLFPLLYFEDLVKMVRPELSAPGRVAKTISEGIARIQSMQLRDGSFSFWPHGDYSYEWGTVYAAHFLIEARKAGYTVPDRMYNRMLDYLARLAKGNTTGYWALQTRAYTLYTLALARKPQLGSMAYLKNQRLNELYDESQALLAGAYYYAGDKKTARELLPKTLAPGNMKRQKGGNLNSTVRNEAIILSVLAEVEPDHPAAPKLVTHLADGLEAGRWGTTQENAVGMMALGKYLKTREKADYRGEILVNDKRIAEFDSNSTKRISENRLGTGKMKIKITGTGDCYYYAEAGGSPLTPTAPVNNGLRIEREYYDRFGEAVDLAKISQGDLLVGVLTITTTESDMENVAIVDLIPAGLEIENPRLATSTRLEWFDEDMFVPVYMDIRDDRLLLFANFSRAGTKQFYYALRAVSRGTYTIPPVKAECMYAPEVYGIGAGGKMVIDK